MKHAFAQRSTYEGLQLRLGRREGFTLVELMVSMTILTVLLLLVANVISGVQKSWRASSAKVSEFREGRRAFDRIVTTLSQATLNNYYVYRYANSEDPLVPPSKDLIANPKTPESYARYSELQFVCAPSASSDPEMTKLGNDESPGHAVFFQAPLGTSTKYRLPGSMNGCGFYIRYGSDEQMRPDFLNNLANGKLDPAYRYRLFEYRSNTEENKIYDKERDLEDNPWYDDFESKSRVIANNVVCLVFSPRRSTNDSDDEEKPYDIAPKYVYNSNRWDGLKEEEEPTDFQLPPMVAVTMVVVDESTAANLQFMSGDGKSPTLATVLNKDWFTDAEKYGEDLRALEEAFVAEKINYRVFTGVVPIKASKWTSNNDDT